MKGNAIMDKITFDHLSRAAYVYVRQSTSDQVANNHESQKRQYNLARRARDLGWSEVVIIDDDLGRSGGGSSRPGFERLLGAICEGRVGAVLALEASRFARNGRDWHTLLEFCGHVNCLIIDEDGVYDPHLINDRILLGMKGAMSEFELSTIRQRLFLALHEKAKRGELFLRVPAGYVKVNRTRIEMTPNLRVKEAIQTVFRRFSELQSIRQVLIWFQKDRIELPVTTTSHDGTQPTWKIPTYTSIRVILGNPIYAGAYSFGRKYTRMRLENGRKRATVCRRNNPETWPVLIHDHHEGYITWAEYERNQRVIADNATGTGDPAKGAIRKGEGLLAGLLRCGRCGRKLYVAYNGKGGNTTRYYCKGKDGTHGAGQCIGFGALRVDQGVGKEVLQQLQPLGIEAALNAIERRSEQASDVQTQLALALEQARFEADRARRQYDAIEPENRLVATELERRWNERLVVVRQLQDRLETMTAQAAPAMTPADRDRIMALGVDLEQVWNHPAVTPEIRKRILRAVLTEVVVNFEGNKIVLLLHWQGGDHTKLMVHKNRPGHNRWTTEKSTEDVIQELSRNYKDSGIATLLNHLSIRTGHGNTWTTARVRSFREKHDIPVYRTGERAERGELTVAEAASQLSVREFTIHRMINTGAIPARQVCKGAPWIISEKSLADPSIKDRIPKRRRSAEDPNQTSLQFQ